MYIFAYTKWYAWMLEGELHNLLWFASFSIIFCKSLKLEHNWYFQKSITFEHHWRDLERLGVNNLPPLMYLSSDRVKEISSRKKDLQFSNNSNHDSFLNQRLKGIVNISYKETLSVIANDPPCKDGNGRFTTIPLKPLSDQVWISYLCS